MDTLSLLQNRVRPIKIKQELLFFQADQYIGSFFTCLLNSVIFLHTNSDWKNDAYMAMHEATVKISMYSNL